MDIRSAILKAADHIEGNPHAFNFWSSVAPDHPGCGTPGCALGWIGTFMGLAGEINSVVCRKAGFGETTLEFYSELSSLSPGWSFGAAGCARALRLYADKYHPAEVASAVESKWVRQELGSWDAIGFRPGEARV